ncbi:MAG TPA: FHA domain-containing protein [Candidatus Hydrogenedentes bacterium]|jgi:pSer/pThr/pTyr-binding forkhead associated (FHA) protein|nr:FHA domain-containing protein [Candidatus Hydrogenedentota bacterium]
MQYALAMLESGTEIQRWPIDIDEVIIGRSDKANVVIEGGSISRRHARLWVEDGIVAAEDLGSRNGIKINGVRTRSGSLQDGDQMEVGKHFFVVTALR